MTRLRDKVHIEVVAPNGDNGVLENFTSFTISNDITQPSEASFEMGDDGSFGSMARFTAPGVIYKVFINDLLRLSGRVEFRDVPLNPSQGSVIRFTVKTLLSDANFASARQGIKFKDVAIKDYLLDLYAQLGFTEDDFIFNNPAEARDQMTGVISTNQGFPQFVDITTHKVGDAKVRPPETIYEAADRQLRRHGLMHWDSPDGKIVVSAPNDTQKALYTLWCKRGPGSENNNVLGINRIQDFSGIPSIIGIFGTSGRRGFPGGGRISSIKTDSDVIEAGFNRPVIVISKGIRKQSIADRAVARELAARSKRKDAFTVDIDGLSFWTGDANIPFGYDTVVDVQADVAGGLLGSYYLHRASMTRDAGAGDRTQLTLLKAGVWDLGAVF
jgi:hypothetical protein